MASNRAAIRKACELLLLLLLGVMTAVVVSYKLGYDSFFLSGTLNLPAWAQTVISAVSFFTMFHLYAGMVLAVYGKQLFRYTLPFVPLYVLCQLFVSPSLHIAGMLMMPAYLLVIAVYKDRLRGRWPMLLLNTLFVITYQFVMAPIKMHTAYTQYSSATTFQSVFIALELIVMLAVMYCRGGISNALGMENLFHRHIGTRQVSPQERKLHSALKEATRFERGLAVTVWLGWQFVEWAIILLVCHFVGNVFFEALVITATYFALGFVVKYRWHGMYCGLISAGLFYAGARTAPSFMVSQFVPVVIGAVIMYGSYKAASNSAKVVNDDTA
jgi:hypothetical protein